MFCYLCSTTISIYHNLTLDSIKLTQFRNYAFTSLHFHHHVNALTGMNGMGKTNVLDAIYYLCLGKSYFTSSDKNIIKQETDFFRIEASIDLKERTEKVVIKSKAGSRKEIEIAGKKVERISDHVGRFPCVIIAPDDVQMMLDGSEERRNFLNNTIVQTEKDYLEDLLLYNALLKRRNMVLKSFSDQKRVDDLLLESISSAMYAPGQRIHERRKLYTEQMMPVFADIYREISNDREKCNIRYESQLSMDSLHNLFAKNKDKDLILSRTTQGIHKDDLIFTMNDEPLRNYASQGQLKSFVLALKLTQYHLLQLHTGMPPILLLDDIFDKLDPYRVHQLLAMLIQKDYGQLFITDTQPDRIIKILQEIGTDYYNFHVDNGSVQLFSSENTHDHAPQ